MPTELGLDPVTTELLVSGRTATDEVVPVGERLLAVNQRSTDRDGGPPGSVTTLRDTTELWALTGRADVARGRLNLLYEAGTEIGTTLDVVRTCQELAEFARARFADFATVDVAEAVLRGEEPTAAGLDGGLRRTASCGIRDDTALYPVDSLIHFLPSTPMGVGLRRGEASSTWTWRPSPGGSSRIPYGPGSSSRADSTR